MFSELETKVIAKLIDKEIQNFSDDEINRVFEHVASPTACKNITRQLISKGLTIKELYSC